jgi:hypothetical protein
MKVMYFPKVCKAIEVRIGRVLLLLIYGVIMILILSEHLSINFKVSWNTHTENVHRFGSTLRIHVLWNDGSRLQRTVEHNTRLPAKESMCEQ